MFFPWPVADVDVSTGTIPESEDQFLDFLHLPFENSPHSDSRKKSPIFHLANVSPSDVISHQTRFGGILQLPKKQVVYLSIQKPLSFDAPCFREEVPCTCLGDAQHET